MTDENIHNSTVYAIIIALIMCMTIGVGFGIILGRTRYQPQNCEKDCLPYQAVICDYNLAVCRAPKGYEVKEK